VFALVAVGLATRLPLLSASLDEVDAANFANALSYGYDIPEIRPHPPGSPVYVFLGWLVNLVFDDPLRTLTLISAILGSLAVVPFYWLVREFTDTKMAVIGSLLFVVNPLIWSFSETALSDTPSMFVAVLLAWLCYRARNSDIALLWAAVVASLAIGIRQPNVALLLLVAFPIGYRVVVSRQVPWRMLLLGSLLFVAVSAAWAVPMVQIGTDGIDDYSRALDRQWSTTVRPYYFAQVESPLVPNVVLRAARFFLGYLLLYAWTASDAKTASTLLLVVPWIFGFGLFLTGFSFKNPKHVFVMLWIASIGFLILTIHFLPRYGLAQLPAFIIACLMGYQFLRRELVRHPRLSHVLTLVGIGSVLVLYGIKYQAPVTTFEHNPVGGIEVLPTVFLGAGLLSVYTAFSLFRRAPGGQSRSSRQGPSKSDGPWGAAQAAMPAVVIVALLVLLVPYSIQGYKLASVAHKTTSPSHRLVEYVTENFDTQTVTPCWDNQTHSFFDALAPGTVPRGYWSLAELTGALDAGGTVVVSERCSWFDWLEDNVGLAEVATFTGDSPVWSKAPSISLYVVEPAARTPSFERPARSALD
jgi:4-amino-4-deoxy-L-arabinose transferase-like glycosyltransferase